MTEVPEQHQPEPSRERSRMTTLGHRIDNGSSCVLLVIQTDDAWLIYGLDPDADAPGVRLSNDRMVLLAKSIVERAQ